MPAIPSDLADALRLHTLVPFAGAGVSAAIKRKNRAPAFPTWRGVLERAAAKVPDDADLIAALVKRSRYLEAAAEARKSLGAQWHDFLRAQFDPLFDDLDPATLALPAAIWRLGSPLVITTNYDKVLHWASADRNVRAWTSASAANFPAIHQGKIDRPTVWHLHGFIETPEEIILTPDGYQLLYPDALHVRKDYEGALDTLRHLFIARPFLFIGFGMEEALRNQIRWVRETFAGGGQIHYVLAPERERAGLERELAGLSVRVIAFPDYPDLLPLLDHLSSLAAEPAPSPPTPPKDLDRDIRLRPREDTFLDRVAAVYRANGDTVEHFLGPSPVGAYLRVTRPKGGCFPVTATDITPDSIRSFAESVAAIYRVHDQGTPAVMIHGEHEPAAEFREQARQAGIALQSFVSLQGLIDFAPYLQRLRIRLDDPQYPPSLYVPQGLTWQIGREQSASDDALETVWQWLARDSGAFIVVLGDFGSGKSFLLRQVARRFLDAGGVAPILIDLRRLSRTDVIEALLANHLTQEGLLDFTPQAVRYMAAEGRAALLFDAYDELELRVGYDQAAQHFATICAAAGGRARVIVTSRTQHFQSDEQVLKELGRRAETAGARLVKVAPFDRPRIHRLLANKLGSDEEADNRISLLDRVRELPRLSSNPRMLGFISEIPIDKLEPAQRREGTITEAGLYQELLSWWLKGEEAISNPQGEKPGLKESELWSAVEHIAVKCWQEKVNDFPLSTLADAARALGQTGHEPEVAAQQIGARSLFVRDGDAFRFLDSSIFEWLVARAAATAQRWDLLAIREISDLMARFVLDLDPSQGAIQWADSILGGTADSTAKKNAFLVRRASRPVESVWFDASGIDLRGQDFTGMDMAGAQLRGANLEGVVARNANFDRADLREARLSGADLTGAILTKADLSGADLSFARLNRADLTRAVLDSQTRLLGAQLFAAAFDPQSRTASPFPIEERPQPFVLPPAAPVNSLAFSPDGQCIASAYGSAVVLRHTATGRPLQVLTGHQGATAVAIDPSGTWLASGSRDRMVRLWEVRTGRLVHTLEAHRDDVLSVAFDPSGRFLASGSYDGTVALWVVGEGKLMRRLSGHQSGVSSLAFNAGSVLASGSQDHTVKLWSIGDGKVLRTLEDHRDHVLSVAFNPSGQVLASGSADRRVRFWDVESGKLIRMAEGHQDPVLALAFDPTGSLLASGSTDQNIKVWDAKTAALRKKLVGHNNSVLSVAFDPLGRFLASSSSDATVRFWEPNTGELLRTFEGDKNAVLGVSLNPSGQTVACASRDGTVRIWDLQSGRVSGTLKGLHGAGVAFSASGVRLACGSYDGSVTIWQTRGLKRLQTLPGHKDRVTSVAFDKTGRWLASGSHDTTVRLWNMGGDSGRVIQGHTGDVLSVAFDPTGLMLASGSHDKTVRLWEVSTGRELYTLYGHEDYVRSVAFSSKGRLLASGSDDRKVKIWDPGTGTLVRTIKGAADYVRSVAFHPQGQILAAASDEALVRLWDIGSGKLTQTLQGHKDYILSVAFHPSGRYLATGSNDGTVRLWNPNTGACIAILYAAEEDWVAYRPDGRYRLRGNLKGNFWFAIGLARFEPDDIDAYYPDLRLPGDAPLIDPDSLPAPNR